MVTGGKGPEKRFKKGLTSVELLLINGTRLCALPDLPVDRWEHSQTGSIALHAEEETAILRPSHVLSSPVAPGSRHTPWGNRVMGTLPGSRPGVVCGSWGGSL